MWNESSRTNKKIILEDLGYDNLDVHELSMLKWNELDDTTKRAIAREKRCG
jgi:hypothetical protein